MVINTTSNPRVRAWVMIQVDAPAEAAQRVWESLALDGGDSYLVCRADVVDYVYNVVIPVDAENRDVLETVYQRILTITGAKFSVLIPVIQYVPPVPHDGEGFITPEEYDRGQDKEHCKPGRQHWSPGINAWG